MVCTRMPPGNYGLPKNCTLRPYPGRDLMRALIQAELQRRPIKWMNLGGLHIVA